MIQRNKLGLNFFSPAFSTPCLSSGPANRSDAWHITVALPAQKGCAQTISANVLKRYFTFLCNETTSKFILKQLDYEPEFSTSHSQLGCASLTICS